MEPQIRRALVATFIARSALNGVLRIVYPFLPAIARGLDVTPTAVSSVIALRNLGGFASPFVARATEKSGRRLLMIATMTLGTVGCLFTAAAPGLVVAGIGIVMVGFAKPGFDISMQGWFGDRVPYGERGRVFGITEFTWAFALLVTVPISGVLIEATNWRAPFVLIAVMCALGTIAIARGIATDRPTEHVRRPLKLTRERVLLLVAVLLFSLASEVPFIVYGQWLEGSFGFSVASIGAFTLVIVAAELLGQAAVVFLGDKLGLRAMFLWGLIVTAVAYIAFNVADSAPLAAMVVIVWIVAFEITIVAAIPFASEMAVESRDRMLSGFAMMVSGGRAVGALVAQPLFSWGGIGGAGTFSSVCVVIAALALLGVPERSAQP